MLDGCCKHRCLKVAETEGRVVAMCTAELVVSIAEGGFSTLVEDLLVTETMRRRGIGRSLLASIEAWRRRNCAAWVQLIAHTQNRLALEFYRKRDWQSTRLIYLRKSSVMED